MTVSARMTVRMDRGGIDRLLHNPAGPVGQELLRLAVRIQNQARVNAPVDTGLLRSRIDLIPPAPGPTGLQCSVVARTNYAVFVHEGTYRMPPNPFLLDAAEQVFATL